MERRSSMVLLTFADLALKKKNKPSRVALKLDKIDHIGNWDKILEMAQVVDHTARIRGAAPFQLVEAIKGSKKESISEKDAKYRVNMIVLYCYTEKRKMS
jgi:hypothetical protein